MKTQQAIVNDSGWKAQVENPFKMTTKWGISQQYKEFEANNPPRPLTKEHTPGAKVTVREVWQYRSKDFIPWQLFPVENMDNYKGYEDFQSYNSSLLTQICFEVVSEEESNHIADVGKKVSVEEAAEKSLEQTLKEHGIYEYDTRIVSAIHNHIIQSGEYVSMKNVEQALRKSLYGYADNYIDSIVISAMQILTILKNKQ